MYAQICLMVVVWPYSTTATIIGLYHMSCKMSYWVIIWSESALLVFNCAEGCPCSDMSVSTCWWYLPQVTSPYVSFRIGLKLQPANLDPGPSMNASNDGCCMHGGQISQLVKHCQGSQASRILSGPYIAAGDDSYCMHGQISQSVGLDQKSQTTANVELHCTHYQHCWYVQIGQLHHGPQSLFYLPGLTRIFSFQILIKSISHSNHWHALQALPAVLASLYG